MLPPAQPDAPPRTARNAVIAGVLLLGALVVGAQIFRGGAVAKVGMEDYMKAGPRRGAELLAQDLLAAYPPGSNLGPLHSQLQRMGFECRPQEEGVIAESCRFRARRSDQVLTAVVDLGHDGLRVQAIAARMVLSAN